MRGGQSPWGHLSLAAGLLLYLGVQGALLNLPLTGWSLVPEVDDALTYVLKTKQLQECWRQNCPALEDLKQQLFVPTPDPAAAKQMDLARSRLFPVYHPLFSLLLLGLHRLGLDLLAAYQWLWRLSPLLFGGAFACLLTVLVGPAAAGMALGLLAFKVFPDTGLHHLVPSNLAMAAAVLVWARLVARQGWAPWTLVLSALILPGIHPVGVLYSLVSLGLALCLASPLQRRRLLLVVAAAGAVLGSFFLLASLSTGVFLVRFTVVPHVDAPVTYMLQGALENLQALVVAVVRSAGGLFGGAPWFLAALTLGWLTLPPARRRPVAVLLGLNLGLLTVMLFYVSSHPGDVILRLWIPMVVGLFGLVGQAGAALAGWCFGAEPAPSARKEADTPAWARRGWAAVLLLAAYLGFALSMAATGAEQVVTYIDYLRRRQPLALQASQVDLLLAQARPGERVLYNSLILMPYYFIHGAMRLGAVYDHPDLRRLPPLAAWLQQPNLRFAVVYHPTVYHPSFAGVDEPRWWISSPTFRSSPLDRPRRFGPLAREGKIPLGEYDWLELEVAAPTPPTRLRLQLENRGEAMTLGVAAVPDDPARGEDAALNLDVPAGWSGWREVDLRPLGPTGRLRLLLPPAAARCWLSGLGYSDSPHTWPWQEQARLRARPRDPAAPEIRVSFDPRSLVPPPLRQRTITVLDDRGSSVLLRLD